MACSQFRFPYQCITYRYIFRAPPYSYLINILRIPFRELCVDRLACLYASALANESQISLHIILDIVTEGSGTPGIFSSSTKSSTSVEYSKYCGSKTYQIMPSFLKYQNVETTSFPKNILEKRRIVAEIYQESKNSNFKPQK